MVEQVVEIGEAGLHLSLYRGFLKVSDKDGERGRVPLDDMTALILSAPDATVSKNILVALSERGVPVVVCGKNWHPVSMMVPVTGHYEGAGILYDQIDISVPLQKRLWQTLVKEKISNQALVIQKHVPDSPRLTEILNMARRVRSGDPDNLEAQAARLYWPALMGENFRRDYYAHDQNSLLNYGYTVLRAATARAVCAAGLNTALGVHHRNRKNSFCLVDDLMEPFRPLIDDVVRSLWEEHKNNFTTLTPDLKQKLTAVLVLDLEGERGMSPLVNCLYRLAQSVRDSFQTKSHVLVLPKIVGADNFLQNDY